MLPLPSHRSTYANKLNIYYESSGKIQNKSKNFK